MGDVWRRPGDRYFYMKRLANQGVDKLYARVGLTGAERLLVDPATISLAPENQGKGPSSIQNVAISGDGRYVAVGITPGGAENDAELHAIDVTTGRETGMYLHDPSGWAAWLPGNRSLCTIANRTTPLDVGR